MKRPVPWMKTSLRSSSDIRVPTSVQETALVMLADSVEAAVKAKNKSLTISGT
jgi:hypothetical protein